MHAPRLIVDIPDSRAPAVVRHALSAYAETIRRKGLRPPDWLLTTAVVGSEQVTTDHNGPPIDKSAPLPEPIAVGFTEAARRLGVSLSTIKRSVSDGQLPAQRIRGRRLIAVADLQRFTGKEDNPMRENPNLKIASAYRRLPSGQAKAKEESLESVKLALDAYADDADGRSGYRKDLLALLDGPATDDGPEAA